ncbi:MAG: DUF3097 family protein [Rothia sp. (in: high G+C Gram-positive bacteria)]|uniref:DUF3097 family protein n=1 Tax=Rothia sp. (in: high G+C Gram-positive bacteria) TaxID=1885016 RepID=UPI0026DF9136|nr:DUF3097 family protein [Rothia sp. (in: high G+C Gram-positive bacteria)]MDO5750657.1 DUF3097 family protein [Rothia sp. (in: high G+C Gram-positive bacteria)]
MSNQPIDPYAWGAQDLNASARSHRPAPAPTVELKRGMLLEDPASGWVGEVVSAERIGGVLYFTLEDAKLRRKKFPLGPGYLLEGQPVEIIAPAPRKAAKQVSRSGSYAVTNSPARVARASRIWVEGLHDAELVEKIWGHDLRVEGVAVEPLHGIDDLAGALRAFEPTDNARIGVLVDHLVPGTKEERIVREALASLGPAARHVKVVGHPFIDIWQAIKPEKLGLKAWPQVPRGEDFKKGTLARLQQPHETQEDIARAWQLILSRVDSYKDLQPSLLGPVESLIDFVTGMVDE